MRLALFDFDGTLCRANTLDLLFWRAVMSPRAAAVLWAAILRKSRLTATRTFKNQLLASLAGMRRDEVRVLGERFYDREVRPRLLVEGLKEIDRLRSGWRVIIVSGAFDFLLDPFCREWNVPERVCCQLAYENDCCLGRIATSEMLGAEKLHGLRQYLGSTSVEWGNSRFYTDHLSDAPLLGAVGGRFLVNCRAAETATIPAGTRILQWEQVLGRQSSAVQR